LDLQADQVWIFTLFGSSGVPLWIFTLFGSSGVALWIFTLFGSADGSFWIYKMFGSSYVILDPPTYSFSAAQADAERLAAERAHRAEHNAAVAELNNKLKAQNQLARAECGAKHDALATKNKRALCGQLAAGLLYAAVDYARTAAAVAHRIDEPTKFTLNS
jgi:hypothetical protein